MIHKKSIIISLFFFAAQLQSESQKSSLFNVTPEAVNNYFASWVVNSREIGEQLFTQNSMKILSGFVPFYLSARHIDNKVHDWFHDTPNHRNIHQPPEWMNRSIDYEVMEIPAWICRALSIVHPNLKTRRAMQYFTVGLTLNLAAKWIIRGATYRLKLQCAARPKHEAFSRVWKSYYGLPSGHATMIAFVTVYLGLYKGPIAAIPLGLYTGYVMTVRVANNSHFVSQVIAGAALGAIFGAASYYAYQEAEFNKDFSVGVGADSYGRPAVSVAYNF